MKRRPPETDRERLIYLARFVGRLLTGQQQFFNATGADRQYRLKTCKALEAKARLLTAFVLKDAPEETETETQTALDMDAPEVPPKTEQNAQLL